MAVDVGRSRAALMTGGRGREGGKERRNSNFRGGRKEEVEGRGRKDEKGRKDGRREGKREGRRE